MELLRSGFTRKELCQGMTMRALLTMVIALSAVTAYAQNTSKPANWPAGYTWFSYTETVPLPAGNPRLQLVHKGQGIDTVQFNTLPLQYAFARVHGTGERKIAVFSDPNCPYSQQLEKVLNKLPNVTIYTFVAPLLSPSSADRINQILCQPTNSAKAQAYDAWMLAKQTPQVVAPCANTANSIMQALSGLRTSRGQQLTTSSPIVVYGNNILLVGAPTAQQVNQLMALPPQ